MREKYLHGYARCLSFSNTIEDNIAFGNTLANLEQVQMMAEIADAHSFISRMPEGYATIVGERGVGLSGGQKQRISLARALTKDPAILILDDTTSAVDMETESKFKRTRSFDGKEKRHLLLPTEFLL